MLAADETAAVADRPARLWSPRYCVHQLRPSAASDLRSRCWRPAGQRSSTPAPVSERADDMGPLLPGFHRARAAPARHAATGTPFSGRGYPEGIANTNFSPSATSTTSGFPRAQDEGATLDVLPLTPRGKLRASIADPSWPASQPEVCWVGRAPAVCNRRASRRNQGEEPQDGPGSRANQGGGGGEPGRAVRFGR